MKSTEINFLPKLKKLWVFNRYTAEHHLPNYIKQAAQELNEPITLGIITIATDSSELHNLNALNKLPNNILADYYRLSLLVADDYESFSERDAREILEFLEEVADKVNVLVVTCQAGLSRSPAIAIAIDEILLHNKPSRFYRYYANTFNRHIYTACTKCWIEELQKREGID